MNTLRFCQNNLDIHPGMDKVVQRAKEEFTNVSIETEPCLGRCDLCAEKAIAMANDDLVHGDTSHLLFERIKNSIGEREVAAPNIRQ